MKSRNTRDLVVASAGDCTLIAHFAVACSTHFAWLQRKLKALGRYLWASRASDVIDKQYCYAESVVGWPSRIPTPQKLSLVHINQRHCRSSCSANSSTAERLSRVDRGGLSNPPRYLIGMGACSGHRLRDQSNSSVPIKVQQRQYPLRLCLGTRRTDHSRSAISVPYSHLMGWFSLMVEKAGPDREFRYFLLPPNNNSHDGKWIGA
jgi:hypothetical protein